MVYDVTKEIGFSWIQRTRVYSKMYLGRSTVTVVGIWFVSDSSILQAICSDSWIFRDFCQCIHICTITEFTSFSKWFQASVIKQIWSAWTYEQCSAS